MRGVLGDCVAENRGADYVKPLALSLCARTRNLTRHRAQHNQAELARVAHGAGQHRDYVWKQEYTRRRIYSGKAEVFDLIKKDTLCPGEL